jgi:peroxiredoxin Q/BCP
MPTAKRTATTTSTTTTTSSKKTKTSSSESIEVGSPAPAFTLLNQSNEEKSLSDYLGKWVVLYFYPKDNTPGCTKEAQGFQQLLDEYTRLGAVVVGVSRDSTKSHTSFCSKYGLEFDLLSDPDRVCVGAYGAKKGESVRRSTVLIDPAGLVAHYWNTVSQVAQHPAAVLDILSSSANDQSIQT